MGEKSKKKIKKEKRKKIIFMGAWTCICTLYFRGWVGGSSSVCTSSWLLGLVASTGEANANYLYILIKLIGFSVHV